MTPALLAEIQQWFDGYVAGFAGADGRLAPMLELKLAHSRRVAAEAEAMARELGWTEADVLTAATLGLLHDAGRFSQYQQYRTLSDRDSINHAHRGCEVLAEHAALARCLPERRQQILDGIRHHNARDLAAELPPASLRFIRLIRDADKLDIFEIFFDSVAHNGLARHPEMFLGVDLQGPPTPELVQTLADGRSCSYHLVRTLPDLALLQLAWMHDLNYAPSFRRVRDRGVLERLLSLLPPTPEIRALAPPLHALVARRC